MFCSSMSDIGRNMAVVRGKGNSFNVENRREFLASQGLMF